MKKVLILLMCLFAMMVAGTGLRAQEVTITLNPGWNWISYPNSEAMSVATAFGDFVPMAGDIVKSRINSSTYINGQWRGGITQFTPGWGYMYYSSRTAPVLFAFSSPSVPVGALIVTTSEPTDITATTAMLGGSAVLNDSTPILMKGVCWATHPLPTTYDAYSENGSASGAFTVEMTGLTPNTVYYVRAYAVSVRGINYGEELSFTTESDGSGGHEYVDLGLPSGILWATCNVGASTPEGYGDYFAWGETQPKEEYSWNTYQYCNGNETTLTKYCSDSDYGYNGFMDNLTTLLPEDDAATANWGEDWRMPTKVEWQELYNNTTVTWTTQNGVAGRLFTASNGNSIFLPAAGFRYVSSPYEVGSDGYYWSGTLDTGTPYNAWYIDFSSSNYSMGYLYGRSFGRSVRAVHSEPQNNDVPTGAVNGKFTINEDGVQVYFSRGNLQYIGSAATPYWKFADNQWDYLGETTGQNSDSVSVDRDLFGWGTSGYNHGAVCYQPWSTSTAGGDYNVYGAGNYNLYDQTGQADWGYNPISNGGNVENSGWHTLTKAEWNYVLKTRSTASGNRFVRAKVNNINGIILLPDDWDASYYPLNNSTYASNTITSEQWPTLEDHGAVFLPAVGSRDGTSVSTGGNGSYWTASYSSSAYAYYLFFSSSSVGSGNTQNRRIGSPVRLVHGVQPYTISVSASLADGGTITGAGTYQQGQSCILTATANTGYAFVNWTENDSVVSTNPTYSFAVNANRTIVANYAVTPTGAVDGLFSVSANTQVFFSQGNLQYMGSASTPYWKFADNQWDYFGETTGQNSDNANVDRDLFGWATSGYDHGATCYQPWSTSTGWANYYAYGSSSYNLFDQTGQADWGYNPISNGGNQSNQWRTLTTNEWKYVFNTRNTASGIRYAKANVNNVNGVILLPDDWRISTYSLNNPNTGDASYTSNTLTASQWSVLEQHGAIFLPAAGSRSGTTLSNVGSKGYFWSATHDGQQYAYNPVFSDSGLDSQTGWRRNVGFSVRLVRTLE